MDASITLNLYRAQGYQFPEGWTEADVLREQKRLHMEHIYVPVCVVPGVVGWGVPMVDGKYMKHP